MSYTLFNKPFHVTPVKLIIALVVVVFTLFDSVPKFAALQIDSKYLAFGGLLSGFFGGLSGNQGALRTVFLVKLLLNKEKFIATGVVIACFVDISRLIVYSNNIIKFNHELNYWLVGLATISAFTGTYLGNKLLKKITITLIQYITASMLLVFSVLLGLGLI